MADKLLPPDAVQAIQDSVKTSVIAVDGVDYTTRLVFAPPIENPAETLGAHTLTGLVDFLAANIDKLKSSDAAIQIASFDTVNIVSVLGGRPKRRDVLLTAKSASLGFVFGRYYDLETFNVALQSLFVDDNDRANVLKVIGGVKEEKVGEYSDDGVSQTVVAKAGIARVSDVRVPNPVTLRPYRTFAEVEQPASPFVLRMKRVEDDMPECALYEADGGKWKLTAIENIAKYLRIKVAELKKPMGEIAIIA